MILFSLLLASVVGSETTSGGAKEWRNEQEVPELVEKRMVHDA